MKFYGFLPALVILGVAAGLKGAVPPPDQLLPADTLFMVSAPDWTKLQASFNESSWGRFLGDPSLKAFKDKLVTQFRDDLVIPLERQLGVKLADYLNLLSGQVTYAQIRGDWTGAPNEPGPSWVLLVDARDQAETLSQRLAEVKKRWIEAGKTIRSEKIRGIDFTVLVFTDDDLKQTWRQAFPGFKELEDEEEESENASGSTKTKDKLEISIGQSESLLLVGSNTKAIERILARQLGGSVPSLAEQASFEASRPVFRDAALIGWLNVKPIIESFQRHSGGNAEGPSPLAPSRSKIFSALGFQSVNSMAAGLGHNHDGSQAVISLNVPQEQRRGIISILAPVSKDASPPPFVPADVVKFNRWRLDGQKAWATLEGMLAEISPELSGLFQLSLSAAGKEKDPDFDLKRALIGNLGDDFIKWEKAPRSATLEALNEPPSILLVGSGNSETLAQAFRTGSSLFIPPSAKAQEREFRGRKIMSLPLPSLPDLEGPRSTTPNSSSQRALHFSASGGYVAISQDEVLLEEYLRSSEGQGKSLAETAGMKEAAQLAGGMSTGLFGYENFSESIKVLFELTKRDPNAIDQMFQLSPLRPPGASSSERRENVKGWFDFALLPPFEKVAKYFHFTVYTGSATPNAVQWKFVMPTPPGLRQ